MKQLQILKVLGLAAALMISATIQLTALPGPARASVIYDYVGNNFTSVTAPFSTGDSITGFVEFGSQPAPGATGVSNVVAFSFSAGPLTITDTTATISAFTFDFDFTAPFPQIVSWDLFLRATTATSTFPLLGDIFTCDRTLMPQCTLVTDQATAPFAPGLAFGTGRNLNMPGIWNIRATPVPEPGTLWLMLTGLAALALVRRRVRR